MSDAGAPQNLTEIAGRALRDFIANSPAAFLMLDHNLCQLEASPRWRSDFGGIATGLLPGKHLYDSYPGLPDHLRAAHRKGLAGEVTRAEEDRFTIRDTEVSCAWEVRPWGDVTHDIGGIIIYAESLNKIPHRPTRASANGPCQPNVCLSPSSLMARGILWTHEGSDAMQSLLSSYREVACTCEAQCHASRGHQPDCPAHATVPMIVKAEQTIRHFFMLEELLRKDWTLVN